MRGLRGRRFWIFDVLFSFGFEGPGQTSALESERPIFTL